MLHPYARWYFGPTPDVEVPLPSEDAEEHAVAVLDDPTLFASWGLALVTLTGMHWWYVRALDEKRDEGIAFPDTPHGGPYRAHWASEVRLREKRDTKARVWLTRVQAVWEIIDLRRLTCSERYVVSLTSFVDHQIRASLAVHRSYAGAASFAT